MYSGLPVAPVDAGGVPLDRGCVKCVWSAGPGAACLPADGTPGGLLVVGDSPVAKAARPFASKSGSYVRQLVNKFWQGPVVYDYAVKCPAKSLKMKDAAKPIKECRAFLASVVEAAKPTRVLALGSWASAGLLGRSLDMESARRGYGWIMGNVPVFFAAQPVLALENKFLRVRYEKDVEWALTCPTPKPSHVSGIVHVVENEADALLAESVLADQPELLFDVETAGVCHGKDFVVLCAGLAAIDELESDSWVWSSAALEDPKALAVLQRLLRTKKIAGSNIKYDDIAADQCLGVKLSDISFDTQIVRKLMEPTAMGRLDYVAELVGQGGHKEQATDALAKVVSAARRKTVRPGDKPHSHWCVQAIRNGAEPAKYKYGLLPDDILWRYNGRDVSTSAAGVLHLRKVANNRYPGELACWETIHRPALPSFRRIERVGIQADQQAFEAFSSFLNVGLTELKEKFKAYGPDFNPNSTKQVADILFNQLKLPKFEVSEKTGDPSTSKDVLERLRGRHPFVDHILEWRRLEKMDGTYARGMIEHILSDGRIHPTFRLDGTETLRVSSENPNGQNLPRGETVEGKMARDCFTASSGRVLIELDQSQIELRVAAGMSGDPDMIEIFKSGQDYHMATAKLIAKLVWGLAVDAVGEFHRQYCKTVNFGLLYGKTDAGLAQQLGCSLEEAAAVRRAILGRFKKLAEMIKQLLYHVRRYGSIDVPWIGAAVHTRPLYEAASHDKWKKMNAENASINTPIQGRAAVYTIASIPLIHQWIDENNIPAEIVNTVHDSIMLDAEPEAVDIIIENCSRIMTSFDCWGVPLIVDAKVGDRWGSLRKIKRGEKYAEAQVRWVVEGLSKSA